MSDYPPPVVPGGYDGSRDVYRVYGMEPGVQQVTAAIGGDYAERVNLLPSHVPGAQAAYFVNGLPSDPGHPDELMRQAAGNRYAEQAQDPQRLAAQQRARDIAREQAQGIWHDSYQQFLNGRAASIRARQAMEREVAEARAQTGLDPKALARIELLERVIASEKKPASMTLAERAEAHAIWLAEHPQPAAAPRPVTTPPCPDCQEAEAHRGEERGPQYGQARRRSTFGEWLSRTIIKGTPSF
jgi:hypothetical protein